MGLSPHEFYCMTPAEFFLKCRGHNRLYWQEWERTRFIAYNVVSTIPRKRGKRLPSMSRWFPLPTDKTVSHDTDVEKMKTVWDRIKDKLDGK